jgi:hypothetical protein
MKCCTSSDGAVPALPEAVRSGLANAAAQPLARTRSVGESGSTMTATTVQHLRPRGSTSTIKMLDTTQGSELTCIELSADLEQSGTPTHREPERRDGGLLVVPNTPLLSLPPHQPREKIIAVYAHRLMSVE